MRADAVERSGVSAEPVPGLTFAGYDNCETTQATRIPEARDHQKFAAANESGRRVLCCAILHTATQWPIGHLSFPSAATWPSQNAERSGTVLPTPVDDPRTRGRQRFKLPPRHGNTGRSAQARTAGRQSFGKYTFQRTIRARAGERVVQVFNSREKPDDPRTRRREVLPSDLTLS
jgi:hypothetical protein